MDELLADSDNPFPENPLDFFYDILECYEKIKDTPAGESYLQRVRNVLHISDYENNLALCENMGNVEVGLSDQQVDNLTKETVKNNTDFRCPICLEVVEKDETLDVLKCGHKFHDQCIREWLVKNKHCPICRCEVL